MNYYWIIPPRRGSYGNLVDIFPYGIWTAKIMCRGTIVLMGCSYRLPRQASLYWTSLGSVLHCLGDHLILVSILLI